MKKTKVIIFIVIILISICTIVLSTSYDTSTVYISDDSSKYHLQGCDEMHSRPKRTTVATAQRYGWAPCKVCNPYGLADEFYGTNNKDVPTENFLGFTFIASIISFFICNHIVNLFLKDYNRDNEYVDIALKCRMTISFNILALIVLRLIDVNILTWIGIVYYAVITFTQLVLLIGWIHSLFQERNLDRDMKKILICNIISMIINGCAAFALYEILN